MPKIENDAYFTPDEVALKCVEDFYKEMPEYRNLEVVEPSAGGGSFLRAFDKFDLKYEAYDLNPQAENIVQADYLSTEFDLTGKVVLGNPPYGFRNKLTKQFIKKSFEQGAEVVGFLLFGSILNYYHLKNIGYELIYYKRIYDFSFVDYNNKPVLNTAGGLNPVLIVFGKNKLQQIKKNFVENGTKEDWTFYGNYGGFKERGDFSANSYSTNQSKNKVVVSGDSTRVSYIFNVNKDFEKHMYEGLMWMYIGGKVTVDSINFHASYPELNKGWIQIEDDERLGKALQQIEDENNE